MLSRLQDKTSTFKGPMDVLKHVIRKEGPLGLYAGMESTFWRYIIPISTWQLVFHLASDRYTGMEDISVAFIKSKCYFQNLMSGLPPPSELDLIFFFFIFCRAHKRNSWTTSCLVPSVVLQVPRWIHRKSFSDSERKKGDINIHNAIRFDVNLKITQAEV